MNDLAIEQRLRLRCPGWAGQRHRIFNWAYGLDLAATMMAFIFVVSMLANRLLKREAVEY